MDCKEGGGLGMHSHVHCDCLLHTTDSAAARANHLMLSVCCTPHSIPLIQILSVRLLSVSGG
eukprot:COSAG06_NODE_7931_length_2330_cov_2.569251_3_plen_62_part_00